MITFEGFKTVTPVTNEQLKLSEMGVQFLTDNTGRCWYDIIKELQAEHDGEYVIVIDDESRVRGWSKVADSLFPVDSSIVVTNKVPLALVNGNGAWKFDKASKTFIPDTSVNMSELQARKDNELYNATTEIDALKDAVEADIATEAEIERLAALKAYRIKLIRLDVSGDVPVTFPEKP